MEVRVFSLREENRSDLEELLFQLSGKIRIAKIVRYQNVYNIGAFDAEKLVGFAQLFVLPKTTFTMGHLEDVVVSTEYQGKGLGRRIVSSAIELAKEKDCSVVNLTTRPEREDAVKLYTSLGFTNPGNNVYRLNLKP